MFVYSACWDTILPPINRSLIFSDNADSRAPLTQKQRAAERQDRTKRIALLILAITIHNIPEGLAVGVGFATDNFQNARNLAIGIGIQVGTPY